MTGLVIKLVYTSSHLCTLCLAVPGTINANEAKGVEQRAQVVSSTLARLMDSILLSSAAQVHYQEHCEGFTQ